MELLSNNAPGRRSESLSIWIIRVLWLALPLLCGPSLEKSFHDLDSLLRTTVSISLWTLWALIFVATLITSPISLAIVRIGVPAAAALCLWCSLETDGSTSGIIGFVASGFATSIALSAPLGDKFSDGASYGDERRFLLRAPGPVSLFFGPLAWLITVTGLTLGPTLLLNQNFLLGSLLSLCGLPLAAIASNAIYQLGKRWIILVPAGIVLHDHLSVGDPTLINRNQLTNLSPAVIGTDALDLSQGSFGLSLQVSCSTPLSIMLRKGTKRNVSENSIVESFLINPARPNVLLAEAEKRNMRI